MVIDPSKDLYINTMWMCTMYCLSPILLKQLSRYKSSITDNRSHLFSEDLWGIWTIGIMVCPSLPAPLNCHRFQPLSNSPFWFSLPPPGDQHVGL